MSLSIGKSYHLLCVFIEWLLLISSFFNSLSALLTAIFSVFCACPFLILGFGKRTVATNGTILLYLSLDSKFSYFGEQARLAQLAADGYRTQRSEFQPCPVKLV